jgi:glucose/mannose transport system substrate-binding protein
LLGVAALFGCADSPDTVRLEVYSWWEEESERRAFEAVIDIHQSRHENVEVVNLGNDEANEIRQIMAARVLAGAPPATFQANLGADLLRWTMVETEDDPADLETDDDVVRSRWIRDLSSLYGKTELDQKLMEGLMEGLVVEGESGPRPYAVPINVHRLNVLYYNVEALAAVETRLTELGRPGSLLDVDRLCDENFDDTGLEIAIGRGEQFTLVLLAFESVLPALYGAEFYNRLFTGERWASAEGTPSVEVRRVLECVQNMSQWFIPENVGWADAVERVNQAEESATFTVMGDWANGLLLGDPDEQIVKGVPFPAKEGMETFVYTSDTFPLPIGTEHPQEAEALLETIASSQAQLAFSAQKGSIPARDDVSIESLPESRTRTRDDYRRLPRVLATSGLFPPYYPQALLSVGEALFEMTEPGAGSAELEHALRVFTDAEPLLYRWQERMSLGAADPYEP